MLCHIPQMVIITTVHNERYKKSILVPKTNAFNNHVPGKVPSSKLTQNITTTKLILNQLCPWHSERFEFHVPSFYHTVKNLN